jgi:hypothetical protein
MSNCPFCNLDADSSPAEPSAELAPPRLQVGDGGRSTRLLPRAWRGVQWIFPSALLVLMPKCPLCVAAYVAVFTGVGITVSSARWVQTLMLVICWTTLAYLAVRHWWRRSKPRQLKI